MTVLVKWVSLRVVQYQRYDRVNAYLFNDLDSFAIFLHSVLHRGRVISNV